MFEDVIVFIDEKISLQTLLFAQKLGMKEVLLLFKKHGDENRIIAEKLAKESKLKIYLGLNVAVKDAQKYSNKYDALFAPATRDAVENKQITHVYGAEILDDKDKTHQRGSGLNHVLVKLITEKKKVYCFDFSLLLEARDVSLILGRMMQNKKFFTKYKTEMKIFSFADDWRKVRSFADRKYFLDKL